ncbi:MAG: HEAT repeat domain-containing protein, partial [Gemmatimonadota bacterium]
DYDVDGAIECFRVKTLSIENECPPGILAANGVTRKRSAYPPEVVEGVLDGLIDLALSASEQLVRSRAIVTVAGVGSRRRVEPMAGIVERLGRLYEEADRFDVRFTVANVLQTQHDTARAIDLLKRIARDDGPRDRRHGSPPALLALESLRSFGQAGRTALQELHADLPSIRNPAARSTLVRVAKNNFYFTRQGPPKRH